MSWNDPVSPCIAIRFMLVFCSISRLSKKLRFHLVFVKRSLIVILACFSDLHLTYGLPLHSLLQSKSNSHKSKRSVSSHSSFLP